ncbi:MAG TPA: 50S ribosomal protein L29 [Actinomycetota bacterium]|nr:50S ribosomal protein L29 [Actinomycetota bacterium]
MAKKTDDLKEMPVSELTERLENTREELFNMRFQLATGQLDNYRRVRVLRRDIARVKTVLREREQASEGEGTIE